MRAASQYFAIPAMLCQSELNSSTPDTCPGDKGFLLFQCKQAMTRLMSGPRNKHAPIAHRADVRKVSEVIDSRIGPLIGLPAVLEGLGVSPLRAFEQAEVPPGLFDSPENAIPQEPVLRLLSVCAELTGRSDFGLLVGTRFTLNDFGPLGKLMRNAATVGEAMRMLILHLHFYDRTAIPMLFRAVSTSVFLGYSNRHPDMAGIGQLQDAAMAVSHRMLGELCGAGWRPEFVQFSHHRPDDITPYRRVFGCRVEFNAELSGLSFATSWLDHTISGADPAQFRLLAREIQEAEQDWPISFAEEVQCILHQLLPGGTTQVSNVAQLFGCSERTLRYRLSSEGTNMQHLLTQTRFQLACHLLRDTELPISHIADALCYSDSAVFTRAFRQWAGTNPREWRKREVDNSAAVE